LVKQVGERDWEALVRPGRKIGVGERLSFNDELHAEVIARGEFGERTLRFDPVPDFFSVIERIGHVPLPPYINRDDISSDRDRYQTVYARERGSVAAPTAGLHFTPEILDRLKFRHIETTEVTLHVGLGTFQPVHEEVVEQHQLHSEHFQVTDEAAKAINRAMGEHRRVIAIGTTAVRTLEYAGRTGQIEPGTGETNLFIYPGYQFRIVSAMLTNFHLPQSTLLMLVSALGGRDLILRAYQHAVEQKYRFYSYGDCMLLE
jgi:S-adenosylmethionine:tRNA ribosyltransferase-isomerase